MAACGRRAGGCRAELESAGDALSSRRGRGRGGDPRRPDPAAGGPGASGARSPPGDRRCRDGARAWGETVEEAAAGCGAVVPTGTCGSRRRSAGLARRSGSTWQATAPSAGGPSLRPPASSSLRTSLRRSGVPRSGCRSSGWRRPPADPPRMPASCEVRWAFLPWPGWATRCSACPRGRKLLLDGEGGAVRRSVPGAERRLPLPGAALENSARKARSRAREPP